MLYAGINYIVFPFITQFKYFFYIGSQQKKQANLNSTGAEISRLFLPS